MAIARYKQIETHLLPFFPSDLLPLILGYCSFESIMVFVSEHGKSKNEKLYLCLITNSNLKMDNLEAQKKLFSMVGYTQSKAGSSSPDSKEEIEVGELKVNRKCEHKAVANSHDHKDRNHDYAIRWEVNIQCKIGKDTMLAVLHYDIDDNIQKITVNNRLEFKYTDTNIPDYICTEHDFVSKPISSCPSPLFAKLEPDYCSSDKSLNDAVSAAILKHISKGGNPNIRYSSHSIPLLHLVIKSNVIKMTLLNRLLRCKTLDPEATDASGATALLWAAKYNPDLVLLLLNAGANAAAQDNNNRTVFYYLREGIKKKQIKHDSFQFVEKLQQARADPTIVDLSFQTFLTASKFQTSTRLEDRFLENFYYAFARMFIEKPNLLHSLIKSYSETAEGYLFEFNDNVFESAKVTILHSLFYYLNGPEQQKYLLKKIRTASWQSSCSDQKSLNKQELVYYDYDASTATKYTTERDYMAEIELTSSGIQLKFLCAGQSYAKERHSLDEIFTNIMLCPSFPVPTGFNFYGANYPFAAIFYGATQEKLAAGLLRFKTKHSLLTPLSSPPDIVLVEDAKTQVYSVKFSLRACEGISNKQNSKQRPASHKVSPVLAFFSEFKYRTPEARKDALELAKRIINYNSSPYGGIFYNRESDCIKRAAAVLPTMQDTALTPSLPKKSRLT